MITSFRVRLTLFLALAVLCVGLPTLYYLTLGYGKQLIADRQLQLQAHASAAAAVLAESLNERRREIELLAQTNLYVTRPLDDPGFRSSLERVQRTYPLYSWIGLASPDGKVRASTHNHLVGVDVSARPWFAKAQEGVYVGDLHEAVLLKKLLKEDGADGRTVRFIDVSVPVYDSRGTLKAILGAHVHWRWAQAVLAATVPDFAAAQSIEFLVVNQEGRIIYPETAETDPQMPALPPHASRFDNAFQRWSRGQDFLIARQAVKDSGHASALGWSVVVRQEKGAVLADVRSIQWASLTTALVSAAILGLVAWIVAGNITQPVARLSAVARRIARGEERVHFNHTFKAIELQRLSDALESMAGSLIARKQALESANQELERKVDERTRQLQEANEKLEALARTDALTGLPNRHAAAERLGFEFTRFQRSGVGYAVLMIDIDFFKRVNDTQGHAGGDAVLVEVGRRIREALRASDFIARLGGEEFLVLLPMTDHAQASLVAEKIRARVAQSPAAPGLAVTVSIGLAMADAADAGEDAAIQRADGKLYQAKAAGRNRVEA